MSHMISVHTLNDTTHVFLREGDRTLSIRSLPTNQAWAEDEGSVAGEIKWFQALALVDMATDMAAEYFGPGKVSLDWIGKGWKIQRR